MRLWSIHSCYLDAKGLVSLWREALLARADPHPLFEVVEGGVEAWEKRAGPSDGK